MGDADDLPLAYAFLESSVRTRIHCNERVTPGVLAVLARFLPRILLIRADYRFIEQRQEILMRRSIFEMNE